MSARITGHLAKTDPIMGALITAAGPYRLRPERDCPPFQALAEAIAHQQLNGVVANRILGRFIEGCGRGTFPMPEQVLAASDADLRAAGFSGAKIAALRDLAAKTHDGVVPSRDVLETLADDAIVERLTAVRGIGRWTVEMMLMFQLGRPDVLPVDDFGVRNGFRLAYGLRKIPTPRALAAFGERWRPYRTAAAWYLWRAIELAKAGTLPPLAKEVIMKLRHNLSIGLVILGMTGLVGYASGADIPYGDQVSDSTLVAQSGAGTGGTGSGSTGGMGSGNAGSGMPSGSTDPGKATEGTYPEKASPGMGVDPGMRGTPGSSTGTTGATSGTPGSSTGPTSGSGSSGMSGSGSGSSSGSGGGGK